RTTTVLARSRRSRGPCQPSPQTTATLRLLIFVDGEPAGVSFRPRVAYLSHGHALRPRLDRTLRCALQGVPGNDDAAPAAPAPVLRAADRLAGGRRKHRVGRD